MSEGFDWQTEEEGWDSVSTGRSRPNKTRRTRWFVAALIALGLVVTAAAIYRQIEDKVSEVESKRAADILSSYSLIRQASERHDNELFRAMLSGSDLDWAQVQQALFARDLLFDRLPFGLERQNNGYDVLDVNLSTELASANVITEQRYDIIASNGLTESIKLKYDDVYRQGERWLWSPPRDEYWGGSLDGNETGQYLTFFFPERDSAIAERLLNDLDGVILDWCQGTDGFKCPDDLNLQVKLSRDPASMSELAQQYYRNSYYGDRLQFNGQAYNLTLPTPSLVGVPVDEASYQALLKGYGAHLIGALAAKLIGEDCCGSEMLYQSVVRRQLVELGLLSWPIQSNSLQQGSEMLPAYSIELLCSSGLNQRADVLNFDIGENKWRIDLADRDIDEIQGMPAGNGLLLLEKSDEGKGIRIRIFLRQSGREHVLFDRTMAREKAERVGWQIRDRKQRLLVSVPDVIRETITFHSYDLSQCDQIECPMEIHDLLSTPTWSPDGSQLLVRQYGMIWRQQGFQATPLANGSAPFWLSDESYGFVRDAGDEQMVVVRPAQSDEIEVVLNTRDLQAALPEEDRPDQLMIGYIEVTSAGTGKWLILAFGMSPNDLAGEALIFGFDPSSKDVLPLIRSEWLHSFNLTPTGDRVAVANYDPKSLHWILTLHDLNTQSTWEIELNESYAAELPPAFDWSPDGDWLMVMNQGIIERFHLEKGAQYTIKPPEAGCTQAVWVTK